MQNDLGVEGSRREDSDGASGHALRAHRLRRRAALIGIGTLVAGGVGVASATGAFAADGSGSSPTPAPSAGSTQPAHARGAHPGPHGNRFRAASHGEGVIKKAGGGYETIDVQRGSVTAVSPSSISVKSADGFTKTYGVTPDTFLNAARDGIGSVKAGDEVNVTAVVNGSAATARSIGDVTTHKATSGAAPATPSSP